MKPLKPRRRGIYLLPNMITISALFCGFYAIVMSLNLEFKQSTVAIFIGMILDSMDGRVARLTRTQSEFGAQLDSLSDMVTFGVAPALVAYEWSLKGMGRMGWVAAFIYCACAALRLARFNTNIAVVDKRFFQGLPSPAAAAIVAGFIWLMDDLGFFGRDFYWTCWGITLYAGLTMVTNVPFYSFKEMNIRKSVPFIAVIVLVLIVVTISFDPPKVLFGLFVLYGLSGYVVYVWHKIKGKPVSIVQTEEEQFEAPDSNSG
ncbi:CDP-diacylglycerol--serine O-phosphatidyltransferase [Oxalobacter vibrioformis]|uniref:CDP-diacylglycerol--serine O-phosphatidyltransferase n=1 Tax=Oxalobacter vibrioformis TaxID=933080 RepID=A0A9E9LVB6_9BURK|nr:CDP-diacylglycerol--serine O-phosphatidyltransferase [Oxalobacter vibrioformis]WAW09392.1 CDP-diacylglycerol--serine O-phosphatidyltransferase [Oxalobacter vibrioformis]